MALECGRFAAGACEQCCEELFDSVSSGAVVHRLGEALTQLIHSPACIIVVCDARRGPPPRVQDGRVVTTAELPADGRKRLAGELAREVHRDLARPGYAW